MLGARELRSIPVGSASLALGRPNSIQTQADTPPAGRELLGCEPSRAEVRCHAGRSAFLRSTAGFGHAGGVPERTGRRFAFASSTKRPRRLVTSGEKLKIASTRPWTQRLR